jgi:hypothetical protein
MEPKQPLDYPVEHDQLEELRAPEHYPEYMDHLGMKGNEDKVKDYEDVAIAS